MSTPLKSAFGQVTLNSSVSLVFTGMYSGVLAPLTEKPLVAEDTEKIVQLAVPVDVELPETLKARPTTSPRLAPNPEDVAPFNPQTLSGEVMSIPVTLMGDVEGTRNTEMSPTTRMRTTNPTRIQTQTLRLGRVVGGGP